jgi:hypothetical protein
MVQPYNNPVPYYACKRCRSEASAQATTTPEGLGVRCEVTVPHPGYALEWLGRVNGICGDDYLELEAFCAQTGGSEDALSALPEQIRKRLGGWYQPADGESFLLYLKDGDYPKTDAGLGGLVLTTQRLVYCKYHKHGAVPLTDQTTQLLAVRHGPFDDLISVADGTRTKMVRLRPDDTEQLTAAIVEIGGSVQLRRADE